MSRNKFGNADMKNDSQHLKQRKRFPKGAGKGNNYRGPK